MSKSILVITGLLTFVLLIVVVPGFFRACGCSMNEAPAVANLRTINTAEVTYLSLSEGKYGTIQDLVKASLLEDRLLGEIDGYKFEVQVKDDNYVATSTPTRKEPEQYGYVSTSDGAVRYATENTATCDPCFPKNLAGAPVQ
jgi:hypothetical protein